MTEREMQDTIATEEEYDETIDYKQINLTPVKVRIRRVGHSISTIVMIVSSEHRCFCVLWLVDA